MRAVLIEGDLSTRDTLLRMLAEQGVRRVEVSEASEAPKTVTRLNPDVVLLAAADVYDRLGRYVPGMLREASPAARILLLGGHKPSERALPWPGVDAFLPYPIDAERLGRAINEVSQGATP